jgi:tRNA(fMet)-specific endonuclease VapC
MKRFLLDTGIAGWYINRRRGVFERAEREAAAGNHVGICTPVLCELAHGVEYSSSSRLNLQRLRLALATWTVWPLTDAAAFEYGRLAAELQRRGRAMQQIDVQIAAVALTLGRCTVVSADTDLLAVPGLAVENWAV